MNVQNDRITEISAQITACTQCKRLRHHCQSVARIKRKAYLDQTYWGKPVPGFGDPSAKLACIGLAPGAHGANRTGRVFTGDKSGEWLYRALYRAGFANQPTSIAADDGLQLKGAYVTCAVRCAPPDNKPTPVEAKRCRPYLTEELEALSHLKVYVALGGFALKALWPVLSSQGLVSSTQRTPAFKHGRQISLGTSGRILLMSYHPSQQNTFTGRLTEPMLDLVFSEARRLVGV